MGARDALPRAGSSYQPDTLFPYPTEQFAKPAVIENAAVGIEEEEVLVLEQRDRLEIRIHVQPAIGYEQPLVRRAI